MMRAQGVGQDVWKEKLRTGRAATGGHFSQPPVPTQEEAGSLPTSQPPAGPSPEGSSPLGAISDQFPEPWLAQPVAWEKCLWPLFAC